MKTKIWFALVVVLLVGTTPAQDNNSPFLYDPFEPAASDYNEVLDLLQKEYIKVEDLKDLDAQDHIDTFAESFQMTSALVEKLGNRWTTYAPPDALATYDPKKISAGVHVKRTKTGAFIADLVMFDTPVYKIGLRHGDELLSIDGRDLSGLNATEVYELLRRTPGKRSTLRYKSFLDGTHQCHRFQYEKEPDVVTATLLPGNIAYFHIRDFSTEGMLPIFAYYVWVLNWEAGGDIRGIILDVRGNPGGYLHQSYSLASTFIEKGCVGVMRNRDGKKSEVTTTPFLLNQLGDTEDSRNLMRSFYELPMVLLVDGSTMSAAEGLTAALKDRQRAVVMGERTWGKSMYFYSHLLTNGGWLTVTSGNFFGPKGVDHHEKGIAPDITVAGQREGEELVLKAALNQIGKIKLGKPDQENQLRPQLQTRPDHRQTIWSLVAFTVATLLILWLITRSSHAGVRRQRRRRRRRPLPDVIWDCETETFVTAESEEHAGMPIGDAADDVFVDSEVPIEPLRTSFALSSQNFYVGSPCCNCGAVLNPGDPVTEELTMIGPSFYCPNCSVFEAVSESR